MPDTIATRNLRAALAWTDSGLRQLRESRIKLEVRIARGEDDRNALVQAIALLEKEA